MCKTGNNNVFCLINSHVNGLFNTKSSPVNLNVLFQFYHEWIQYKIKRAVVCDCFYSDCSKGPFCILFLNYMYLIFFRGLEDNTMCSFFHESQGLKYADQIKRLVHFQD